MITLKELIHATADTIKIDWLKVEETIGFPLHYDLKNFYSRILCAEQKTISGDFILNETDFIQKTGNERYDTWFSFNGSEGRLSYELYPIRTLENAHIQIKYAFTSWTGGHDFGHRAWIGVINTDMGDFLILFNNDTGNVEWIDCGYGYFDVYEENPNGIIANDIDGFLSKLD